MDLRMLLEMSSILTLMTLNFRMSSQRSCTSMGCQLGPNHPMWSSQKSNRTLNNFCLFWKMFSFLENVLLGYLKSWINMEITLFICFSKSINQSINQRLLGCYGIFHIIISKVSIATIWVSWIFRGKEDC